MGAVDPNHNKWADYQRTELVRLGKTLEVRFRAVFDRRGGSEWHPDIRPSAKDWIRDLQVAGNWVIKCRGCGHESVSEGSYACPFCNAAGHHFTVQTPRTSFSVHQEGRQLTSREAGLFSVGSGYPIVTFHRLGERLRVVANASLALEGSNRRLAAGESILLEPGPSAWVFRAQPKDGKQEAVFRVSAPRARLQGLDS
jgi:hypothetical protein